MTPAWWDEDHLEFETEGAGMQSMVKGMLGAEVGFCVKISTVMGNVSIFKVHRTLEKKVFTKVERSWPKNFAQNWLLTAVKHRMAS